MLKAHCVGCGLAPTYCLCAELPQLSSPMSVSIISHQQEYTKASSSGRIAAQVLDNAELTPWQRKQDLPVTEKALLLFPQSDAVPLQSVCFAADSQLVVLDGSWQQARKMLRQSAELNDLPKVRIDVAGPSAYYLRRNQLSGNFCTLESIAMVIAFAGASCVAQQLMQVLQRFQRRYRQQQHRCRR